MQVNITPPNQFGPSRIYFNTTALTAFNSNASISMYHLPFASTPIVQADIGAGGVNGSLIWSQGVGEGNLTFVVNGFSGYNVTDNVSPTISVNSPVNLSTTYYPYALINVSLNGTETPISQVLILLNSAVYVFNSTTNTANCSNLTQGSENFTCVINATSLSNGVYVLNVTAYDFGGASSPGNSANAVTNFTVMSDIIPPTINSASLNDSYFTTGRSVFVNVNATDGQSSVVSVTANGVALNHTGSANASWNGTITLIGSAGIEAIQSVTVVATDFYGNVNTTYLNYTMDTLSPRINVTSISPMQNAVVSNASGNITVTWQVSEGNLTSTNVSIDNGTYFSSSATNGTKTFNFFGLSAGNHTLVISAIDIFGYSASSTTSFVMDRPINATQELGAMQGAVGNGTLTGVTLYDSTGTNQSGNASLNVTGTGLRLDLNVNTSGITNTTVSIPSFNGSSANWNNTGAFNITTNNNSSLANTTRSNSGENVTVLVLFTNMSAFLPNSAYINGTSITFQMPLGGLDVLYISDDTGNVIYKLGACAGNVPPAAPSIMCYLNTSSNVTVYVPHLSGVALANDTLAPTVAINTPVNSSTVNNSYFTLSFNATEANPAASFCWYNVTNASGSTVNSWAGVLTTPTPTGLLYVFTKAISGLANGSYNVTVNCTDLNNQSTQLYHTFTVADSVVPTVTAISASASGSTVTLSVTTNEVAECRYSTSDVAFGSMTVLSSTNALSHSISITYTASSSGTYYVRCRDVMGNTMSSSSSTAYSISISTSGTPTGGTTSCTESWTCTSFGECSSTGTQIRTCTDANNCGSTDSKPDEVQTCTIPTVSCSESWSCSDWSVCSEAGFQTRTCIDANSCGTSVSRPSEVQSCTYTVPVTPLPVEAIVIGNGASVIINQIAAGASQTIIMPAQASISTGIVSIILSAKNALTAAKVEIKQVAKPADVTVPKDATVYKYLQITAENISAGDLDRAIITFKINKRNVQNVSKVKLARYVNGAWVKLTTVHTVDTVDSYMFQAETPGFSYFAVIEETTPQVTPTGEQPPLISPTPTTPSSGIMGLILVVIVLAILAAVYFWYSKRRPWKARKK